MAILKRSSFGKKISKSLGKLIVIDGIDGSGKSTQRELLKQELELNGFKTESIHFPRHGQPTAFLVDEYLKGKYGEVNAYAGSIFYAIDRFDAKEQIQTWLNQGKIVLSDRYVTANAGHQGCKIAEEAERLKFFKWLDNLEYNIFGLPKPDLNIVLNMPYMTAHKLIQSRKSEENWIDSVHEKNLTHLRLAQNVYLQIAQLFPNTKIVECVEGKNLLSQNVVHNQVWELVRRIAIKDLLLK
jgi:dTMP kinase